MNRKAECVVDCKDVLGESPVWSVAEAALYWIDVAKPTLHRLQVETGTHQRWDMGKPIGSFVLRARGGFLMAYRNGLAFVDSPGSAPQWFTPAGLELGEARFNDGKCDRQGRFWVGTMDRNVKQPIGRLFRLDPDLSLHQVDDDIVISNGPCFSPDDRVLYFNDSPRRVTWRYDVDPASGMARNRRSFVSWEGFAGRPDGATVDAEGGLWVAEVHGHRVVRFMPDGRIDRWVELPCERPTSVCFGGPDLRTLYITTSTLSLSESELAQAPLSGGLFAADAGVQGLPETPFAG
jgi:sugar lactone lactonase YvrE